MSFATVNDVRSLINIYLRSVKGIDEINQDEIKNIVSNFAVLHYPDINVAMVTVTSV